jgi:hypothetical protein
MNAARYPSVQGVQGKAPSLTSRRSATLLGLVKRKRGDDVPRDFKQMTPRVTLRGALEDPAPCGSAPGLAPNGTLGARPCSSSAEYLASREHF